MLRLSALTHRAVAITFNPLLLSEVRQETPRIATLMATDYRSTVHLPRTDFPMRANLAEREPRLLAKWQAERIYERLVERNQGGPKFVLHDGPPYANGDIHQGHALNKTLKDLVAKSHAMAGELVDVIPGWDCHGLPIEQNVDKQLGSKKQAMSRQAFRQECRRYAEKWVHTQREQFKRLGVFMRWDKPYLTMSAGYEAQTVRELARFAERGSLYRAKKPVPWCPTHRTALAVSEIEYEKHQSPSIYVAMRLVSDPGRLASPLAGKEVDLVIWTTTPWTLPANLAIAANEKFTYVAYRLESSVNPASPPRIVVVAKDLLVDFLSNCAPGDLQVKDATAVGVTQAAVLKDPSRIIAFFDGGALLGHEYQHPFIDRTSPVLLGGHVTLETGTGLVHTAPGHGQDDYVLGQKHGLDAYAPVDNAGRFTPEVVGLEGKNVFEANPHVIELIRASGHLLSDPHATTTHEYPHCWRCHNPLIFRATDQWFISLAHGDTRRKALEAIDRDVTWIPSWGKARIQGMMENRPDWCISRQRTWGVPIVAFYCNGCQHCVLDATVMRHVAGIFEKETADAWVARPSGELLPAGFTCPGCGGTDFRKEDDILDVWFDSGVSYANVAELMPNQGFPTDLYLEGSDQHRGWFNSSLIAAVGTRDRAPYRTVLTHGFVVDETGKPYSKSNPNYVPMDRFFQEFGADLVRLWVAASDYSQDIHLSKQVMSHISEAYRKIRNTIRWSLGSVDDFDVARQAVPVAKLADIDRWALEKTARYVDTVREAYRRYEFHLVFHATVELCSKTLSALYFDVLKDRLYTRALNDPLRRGSQTVLWRVTDVLCRTLAPILSFTADEAYSALPGRRADSVFLVGLPTAAEVREGLTPDEGERLVARYDDLETNVRAPVQKAMELLKAVQQPLFKELKELEARQKAGALSTADVARKTALEAQTVGNSLDARVTLTASSQRASALRALGAELAELLIVSQVDIVDASAGLSHEKGLEVEVSPARGERCARCWCYTEFRGTDPAHPELCPKCAPAVREDFSGFRPGAQQA
jgi:isoleucyl-tRNA synthetase